ncbi:hypothetical protein B296_00002513 [Ensete ventricosum]|uniref:Uncharacterized protein n=1 Tax=Ensete ventricosum TaxID=4639 RepID=A0A426ZJD1_ENSVE|nr:hypothetical protein B296_00002513 [Ensete ventricosum]
MQWELAESSPEVGQGSDDVVESSPRTHQKFAGKFIGSSPTGCRELAGSLLGVRRRFRRCCRELTENSPEVYREVRREFTDRLSGARREFAGRMLGVHRRKS